MFKNSEGIYFQEIVFNCITLRECDHVLTLNYIIQEEEELQSHLSRTSVEDRYVDLYHFAVDIPWLTLDINIEGVFIHIRFLNNQ